ncbi:MAG: EsaB/YukD family protein [Candidatus Methanofastidiosia archaeon]
MSDVEILLKEGNPSNPASPRSWRLSLPADVEVKQILNFLIPKLGLPTHRTDGSLMRYRLHHVKTDRTLSQNETLDGARVTDRDVCLLLIESEPKKPAKTSKPILRPQEPRAHPQQRPLNQRDFPTTIPETPLLNFPSDLKYSSHHLWIDVSSGHVGITHFLAQQMFILLSVGLPEPGREILPGQVASTIWFLNESMYEGDISLPSPVHGIIGDVNKHLTDRFLREAELELIQDDPYGEGWLFTIQISKPVELNLLMDAATYQESVYSI